MSAGNHALPHEGGAGPRSGLGQAPVPTCAGARDCLGEGRSAAWQSCFQRLFG